MLSGISRRRRTDTGRLHFCEVPGGVRVTETGSKGWGPGTGRMENQCLSGLGGATAFLSSASPFSELSLGVGALGDLTLSLGSHEGSSQQPRGQTCRGSSTQAPSPRDALSETCLDPGGWHGPIQPSPRCLWL